MAATDLRPGLPPLPKRMRHLPIDDRGYPVPHFVAWMDGKPDHRVMDGKKLRPAIERRLCWMCGLPLSRNDVPTFCIGPMCCITRTIAEPPSHIECLRWAVRACPFLTRPRAKRRDANLPDEAQPPAGEGLRRNPGAVCLWSTLTYRPWRPPGGGILFELGDPIAVEWWAEGRPARRDEIDESIRTGLPLLTAPAEAQGLDAVRELNMRIARETLRLNLQAWPA